jgi:ring-1,2-phenylacetyl-CoA epoxidase subunit PaaD
VNPVPAADLEERRAAVRQVAGAVADPEIPVLTIEDLGVLRDVVVEDGRVVVVITPTYTGCPAMHVITDDIVTAVAQAGLGPVTVRTVLSPAWTTDWMTERGRQALKAYGIAPPAAAAAGGTTNVTFFRTAPVQCPHCGSLATTQLAAFGSTACKSLWRCDTCREPFDHFKAH